MYDLKGDTALAILFGAGAAASRVLIAEVALPKLVTAFPKLEPLETVQWRGWTFAAPYLLKCDEAFKELYPEVY